LELLPLELLLPPFELLPLELLLPPLELLLPPLELLPLELLLLPPLELFPPLELLVPPLELLPLELLLLPPFPLSPVFGVLEQATAIGTMRRAERIQTRTLARRIERASSARNGGSPTAVPRNAGCGTTAVRIGRRCVDPRLTEIRQTPLARQCYITNGRAGGLRKDLRHVEREAGEHE